MATGEYGIDPTSPVANRWISAELDLQDRLRAHSTFWLWKEISGGYWGLYDANGVERTSRTRALSRAYARAVPGTVTEHSFDDTASTLRLRYQASGRTPLELFVPARRFPDGVVLRCDGRTIPVTPDPRDGTVTVRCGSGAGEHLVELEPAP